MNQPANGFERLVATLIGVVLQVVRGILLAPVIALRRMLSSPHAGVAPVEAVRPLRRRVLRPGRPPEAAVWEGDDDPRTRHFALRWGGEVVAVATVVPAPDPDGGPARYQLRGMAVTPELQGRGLGGQLLDAVHEAVGEALWCNARTSARGFYTRHGWTPRGDVFDKPGIGPHVRMSWQPARKQLRDASGEAR